jgi:predicted esterase
MMTMVRRFILSSLVLASAGFSQDLPKGQIIDEVKCKADETQTYALYLPSGYTPDKKWNIILAFDPRGRGRVPVVQFQAAAEKYGYIVAGSYNSRNGPMQVSQKAAKAMIADVQTRFSIDPRRTYVAGQSGGARFALDLALSTKLFAGVIASSAGFAHPMGNGVALPFILFGTAGTEDFNYLEMRRLDRQITTAHQVRIFVGDHTWLPTDLAMEAVEWLEIQAMKSGLRPRDEAMIDRVFSMRKARLNAETDKGESYYETVEIAADFKGLRDVTSFETAVASLEKQKDVRDSLQATAQAELNEGTLNAEILNYSEQLDNPAERAECLGELRTRLTKLGAEAKAPEDSPQRQMARRVIRGVMADNAGRKDPDFQKLLDEVKP